MYLGGVAGPGRKPGPAKPGATASVQTHPPWPRCPLAYTLRCASSSTAEQRTLNPQVSGSNPEGRTRNPGESVTGTIATTWALIQPRCTFRCTYPTRVMHGPKGRSPKTWRRVSSVWLTERGEHHLRLGNVNHDRGTGRLKVNRVEMTAHRVAWELSYISFSTKISPGKYNQCSGRSHPMSLSKTA